MRQKDSIDVTNRKPRSAKGTPFFKLRLQITAAVAAGFGLLGVLIIYSPFARGINEKLTLMVAQYQAEQTDFTPEERWKQQDMINTYNTILKVKEDKAIQKESKLDA